MEPSETTRKESPSKSRKLKNYILPLFLILLVLTYVNFYYDVVTPDLLAALLSPPTFQVRTDLTRSRLSATATPGPDPSILKTPDRKKLAWILHFSYEPKIDVVELLVQKYGKHFELIVIVSPTGRPSAFGNQLDTNGTEIIWSSKCPNNIDEKAGGAMVRCYVRGLRILSSHPNYNQIQYIVLSNDDVLLNMTKVQEFAQGGQPVSSPPERSTQIVATAPLIFSPLVPNRIYFEGFIFGRHWVTCQPLFAQIPEVYKERFRKRAGEKAFYAGADVFFLPPTSVQEFMELGGIVGSCWLEMALVNILHMLSQAPVFPSEPETFVYYSKGLKLNKDFPTDVSRASNTVAIHPFKLSFPQNRAAFLKLTNFY